ncbi:Bug family tripartite tricarboxylate transporter substrate binding protein [Belnapia rosea]|uniref:Bug family tripartite tricarboxylate transporter substrate binding protein n=1 Tax=Belnapia rosea TaxID=938405 RepID=UPI00088793A7|nr:tripartite tricarboxylate transporter substrate binding protein [Belnapia rosea]SDB66794.1 Tripartite-type tricarboxylate transporter, receptor component TctC [Belnapia rosea]
MLIHRRALLAAPALLAAGRVSPSLAQAPWPERPLRLIVPFPGGSTPDIAGRAVAAHYSQVLGQPCVVDNRPGAGGNIGTDAVAKAVDGHTIGVSINGPLSTAPALFPNLPYDPARDLAPISLLMRGAQLLVVRADLGVGDLAGFLARVKASPGKLSFGSVGSGSGGHLAMMDLLARAGGEMLHVPYRGFPPAVIDLVAGRIDAMVLIAAGILPQLREGQVRALAVTAERRIAQAPEVPTLAEAGIADAASYAWIGLVGPAAMPEARVARLAEEAQRALALPQTQATLEAAGFEVMASSPAVLRQTMAEEAERWGGLIRRLGIKAEA